MRSLFVLLGAIPAVWAAPTAERPAARAAVEVKPQVSGTPKVIANVTDPSVSRDSCGSVRIGHRALWTCRDTEPYDASTGKSSLPLIPNTASWTDFNADGTPKIVHNARDGAGSHGGNAVLLMYGGKPTSYPSFFPVMQDECPDSGVCSNGTRFAIWPDSPPMVAMTAADGTVTAYSWISQAPIKGLTPVVDEPAHTLYKFTYSPSSSDRDVLPSVSAVDETFWKEGERNYGSYGRVVHDGVAFLYAQNDASVAIAKVPVHSIEDRSKYQYYVDSKWTSTMPAYDDSSAAIANAGVHQGTFFYSKHFSSFMWIRQGGLGVSADFMITAAPTPEGPWIEPYTIYEGPNGDAGVGSYSLQAHPGLRQNAEENAIYLSWTQQWTTYGAYVTPLVYLKFE